MVPLGELAPGQKIAVRPFEGVPYEEPADDVLVTEADLAAKWAEWKKTDNSFRQAIRFLTKRGLLPLRRSAPAVGLLCKILGFVFGDGAIHLQADGKKGVSSFWAKAIDLEEIRSDLLALGVKPSRIYVRARKHAIQTPYKGYEFEHKEEWVKVIGSGFAALLACLGAPVGLKARQSYGLPAWLDSSPLWHRRLFLAALFGAELTTPKTISGHDTVFGAPTLSMNKRPGHEASGRALLEKISEWLEGFGVRTQKIHEDKAQTNKNGEVSTRLRLVLSTKSECLRALWSQVGYEYNRSRCGLAALAVSYLKRKEGIIAHRQAAASKARDLAAQGMSRQKIFAELAGGAVNRRFVERSLYEGRRTSPRVGFRFERFSSFCEEHGEKCSDGMVWEAIASVEPATEECAKVYDFTVDDGHHNFVANGFVVSNCGVRMVRTNLFFRDVKNQLRELVESLFRNIPTGVGRSGKYSFKGKELHRLLGEGSRYVIERDLGEQRDVDYTEAHGRLDGADPDLVTDHANQRGAQQCGTLGSGNHFLEVQVVDQIFDTVAAKVMGLEQDMVCIMIHSGSRGLGYQVCDDALAMLRNAPQKYGINLPDRQLACAPIDSPEGQKYIGAMRAAANFAWCNRQLLMQQAREVFADVFGSTWQALQMNLIYDVCHNIAKFESTPLAAKRKRSGFIARERRARFRRSIRRFLRCIARSASRSSFPATWAALAGCLSVSREVWKRRLARPVMGRGGR